MTAPILIFGWGNPSRGDDALGPVFIEHMEALIARHPEWGEIECLTDFQLQVENALDLKDRQRVLFVDASINTPAPCTLHRISGTRDASFSTHAISPQSVLQVYTDIEGSEPPPCWLLSIRGEAFELGLPLSAVAQDSLQQALLRATEWIEKAS